MKAVLQYVTITMMIRPLKVLGIVFFLLPNTKSRILYQNYTYTIYTKVCGHPFKLVDSAISVTPVADRCIKSSTPPCNLHRHTLAVEWPALKSSMIFNVALS